MWPWKNPIVNDGDYLQTFPSPSCACSEHGLHSGTVTQRPHVWSTARRCSAALYSSAPAAICISIKHETWFPCRWHWHACQDFIFVTLPGKLGGKRRNNKRYWVVINQCDLNRTGRVESGLVVIDGLQLKLVLSSSQDRRVPFCEVNKWN